jgi:hypothetical protein
LRFKHPDTGIIIQKCREHQQEKKPVIPGPIKDIAGEKQHIVLKPVIFRGKEPIQGKNNGKKNEK